MLYRNTHEDKYKACQDICKEYFMMGSLRTMEEQLQTKHLNNVDDASLHILGLEFCCNGAIFIKDIV